MDMGKGQALRVFGGLEDSIRIIIPRVGSFLEECAFCCEGETMGLKVHSGGGEMGLSLVLC